MIKIIRSLQQSFGTSLLKIYQNTIKAEGMTKDEKQIVVIKDLQRLHDDIMSTHYSWKHHAAALTQDKRVEYHKLNPKQQKQQRKKGFFDFFSRQFSTSKSIRIPGLYLYGGSGCGKTFLADIFYNNLAIQQKRKMHFHQFMASIHAELFLLQKQKKGYDPVTLVAQRNAKKIRLLYLDQLQVTDVADASILRRLFQRLINNQLVLLATTNRPPQDLYKDGHQRQFFLPFIDFIKQQCIVRNVDSAKDYRYQLQRDESDKFKTYLSPIDSNSEATLKRVISLLTGQSKPYFSQKIIQPIPGRKLLVPRSCNLVCIYYFNQLMESTMGDSDFRAICKNFKAIIIRNMRKIKKQERNIANRLIKLFDQAYFRSVQIYIQADVPIDELITPLPQHLITTQQDFAMVRCKSRLMEFQTIAYKQKLSYVEQQLLKNKNIQTQTSQTAGKNQQQTKQK